MALVITVNGMQHTVRARPNTPLLYVLRNELHLHGPHFGCGLGQCGACAVLLGRRQIRSCATPVAGVVGQSITTLEGLPALYAHTQGTHATAPALHPLQQAWIDEQVQASVLPDLDRARGVRSRGYAKRVSVGQYARPR